MSPTQHDPLRSLQETIQVQEAQIADHNLLNKIIAELLASRTSSEAYRILSPWTPLLFPSIQGALYLRTPAPKSSFERVVVWGGFKQQKRGFTQDQCRALYQCRPHHVENSQSGLVCQHIRLSQQGSCSCFPLMVDGAVLGVLHLQSDHAALTSWKRQMAEELAKYCALVFDNLRLREMLSEQAIRDPLTRLFNRRYMEESLQREMADRTQRYVGIIVLDIDHFKKFNTEFTLAGGDALLRAFGDFLRLNIRASDIPCRVGGEEFVVLLPGADLETTARRAEQLRCAVKELTVMHNKQPLGLITISLGVAVADGSAQVEQALIPAIQALDQAKKGGRDRVVTSPCCEPVSAA